MFSSAANVNQQAGQHQQAGRRANRIAKNIIAAISATTDTSFRLTIDQRISDGQNAPATAARYPTRVPPSSRPSANIGTTARAPMKQFISFGAITTSAPASGPRMSSRPAG